MSIAIFLRRKEKQYERKPVAEIEAGK